MNEGNAKTTWSAITVASAITLPYVGMVVQAVGDAANPGRMSRDAARELVTLATVSSSPDRAGVAVTLIALMVGAITTVVVLVIIGLIRRRQSAREAAFGVFGALGLISGSLGLGGLIATPQQRGAWFALVTAAACAAVVVLLLTPTAAMEFERAEMRRSGIG